MTGAPSARDPSDGGTGVVLGGVGMDYNSRAGSRAGSGVGAPALDAVDLELAPGSRVALVGPSGAGKTTLLRLCGAVMPPTRGRLLQHGRDPFGGSAADLRRLRSRVGFIHQDFRLVPQLRVIQNVACGRLGRWSFARAARELAVPSEATALEIHALLERVGIADKLYERTDRLSGGQQQRVAVARALFQEPRLLLADEPVAGVDPARAREVLELLTTEARRRGATLLVSLHDPGLARRYFSELVGLREGRILFRRPAESVDDSLLAELYGP